MKRLIFTAAILSMGIGHISCSHKATEPEDDLSAPNDFRSEKIAFNVVKLTWEDNCGCEDGFRIERKEGYDEWDTVYVTLASNTNYYIDMVDMSTSYTYRLYSFAGDKTSDTLETSIYSIQFAVDQASTGDTVIVPDGIYREMVTVKDKDIVLISENGPEYCIIDGSGFPIIPCRINGIVVSYCQSVVRGFTIRDFSTNGIRCDGASNIIHNIITNNGGDNCTDCGGISITRGAGLISNNIICNNMVRGLSISGSPVIANNTIAYTQSKDGSQFHGYGIQCSRWSSDYPNNGILINNVIYQSENYALHFPAENDIIIDYCNITDSIPDDITLGTGCIDVDPQFVDPENGIFRLRIGSPCIDAGCPDAEYNDADGSRNDIGAYGGPEGNW